MYRILKPSFYSSDLGKPSTLLLYHENTASYLIPHPLPRMCILILSKIKLQLLFRPASLRFSADITPIFIVREVFQVFQSRHVYTDKRGVRASDVHHPAYEPFDHGSIWSRTLCLFVSSTGLSQTHCYNDDTLICEAEWWEYGCLETPWRCLFPYRWLIIVWHGPTNGCEAIFPA